MDHRSKEKEIIEKYQQDEKMMILAFAQWCINHDIDPVEVYSIAYPQQEENTLLKEAVASTVSKEESEEIPLSSLFAVFEIYGNEELAFALSEKVKSLK
ncbi:hypothetical protein D3H55_01875 [Bacillus salacetis]|uniref:YxiS n=1 Tax=Bacillus salacetis TaxID=2315464 RepID=A0A3A1R961_9BACI|nr:hypothetical protein [Bacillus salacetis]RIW38314.1 hypothetical protein D3H55_01875 [Bacillus salacetis]